MALVTRVEKLNKKTSNLMVETGGILIQTATGKEMDDINWTGLLKEYYALLEESMRYNYEFAETIDAMNRKLDLLIDRQD